MVLFRQTKCTLAAVACIARVGTYAMGLINLPIVAKLLLYVVNMPLVVFREGENVVEGDQKKLPV